MLDLKDLSDEALIEAFKAIILDCYQDNDAYNWQHDYEPIKDELLRRLKGVKNVG